MKERREGEKRKDSAKEGGRKERERARAPEAERLREAETEKRESWGD